MPKRVQRRARNSRRRRISVGREDEAFSALRLRLRKAWERHPKHFEPRKFSETNVWPASSSPWHAAIANHRNLQRYMERTLCFSSTNAEGHRRGQATGTDAAKDRKSTRLNSSH